MIFRPDHMMRVLVFGALVLFQLVPVPPATAQVPASMKDAEVVALNGRLRSLEKQLQALQRQVFSSESPYFPKPAGGTAQGATGLPATSGDGMLLADFSVKLSEIERQMSAITGKLEEIEFSNRRLNDRLDRFEKDAEFRFQTLEGGNPAGGAASASTPAGEPHRATTAAQAATPASPEDRYEAAQAMIRRGQFIEAEMALSAFLADHADHALAGNAQFWLGESYYARENYPFAAKAYLEGYQRWPQSAKAPDMLLKLGLALAAMEQPSEACATLAKLLQDFPDAEPRIKTPADRERARLKCR